MGVTLDFMPRKPKKPNDRHKPSNSIRVPKAMAELLDRLAERRFSDRTEEARRAIRELLEREGLMPPASGSP